MILVNFVSPLIDLITSCISGVTEFFNYVTSAFTSIYSIPGVFPSFWHIIPSSITNIFLAIVVLTTFIAVINSITRN